MNRTDYRPNQGTLCSCDPGVVHIEPHGRGGLRRRCAWCGRGRASPTELSPVLTRLALMAQHCPADLDRLGELLRATPSGQRILRRLHLATWRGRSAARPAP